MVVFSKELDLTKRCFLNNLHSQENYQTGNGQREADDVLRVMHTALQNTGQLNKVGRITFCGWPKFLSKVFRSKLIHSSTVCEFPAARRTLLILLTGISCIEAEAWGTENLVNIKRPIRLELVIETYQTGIGHRETDDVLRVMHIDLRNTGQLNKVGRITFCGWPNFLSEVFRSKVLHSSTICQLCYG